MDQITVEAARRGDRSAQSALLRQLQDAWFRFCLGLTGNAEDARDAVQETALRFLRDLPRFRGESSVMTWSMGIAINVTREMKRKMRLTTSLDHNEPINVVRVAETVEHAVASDEAKEILRNSVRDLPDRQREAIVLRFFEEMSVEETAAVMGCAEGTVKATVHQALRAMREKLRQLQ